MRRECARMSLTEQIIEVVERGRALGLSDSDIDEMLFAIGCIRRPTSVERVDRLHTLTPDQAND